MLRITVPPQEFYDERNSTFIYTKEQVLQLEHSLVSLSRWESKWHKPFMGRQAKTQAESLDYVRCMTITQNVNPLIYQGISSKLMDEINAYIDDPMTATTFKDKQGGRAHGGIVTAEDVYSWMFTLGIPMECEKWHLNRLLTLIRVQNDKNAPPKKMSREAIYEQNRQLNAARRKAMNSRG